jgi:outer membrane protein OmpA-like peptidoglycan-associated protein
MKTISQFFALLIICISSIPSLGQLAKNSVQKNPLQLGDKYFAAGEYYTAAHLYGQYLNPSKSQKQATDFPLNIKARRTTTDNNTVSRTDILFKQAESYRLANYWQEAANAYKECLEKDPAKYNDALYRYAVCKRHLGQYTSAEDSLKQYVSMAGGGNEYKDEAEKELQTLIFIQQQLARPDSVLFTTQKLNAANSNEKGAFAPVLVHGNQFLISSTVTDSVQVNGVNPYHSRLFYATLNNGSLETMTAVPIPAEPMINQGAAAISADGKYLYLTQWKKEKGQTVSSIYYSTKQGAGWSTPTLVPSVNVNGYNSKQPFCSTDGKYLFFASDRPGGSGGFDIWYAHLKDDGTTGEPVNAGTIINTKADEQAPFYHNSSNTLVFSSNGRQGMGGYDLFESKGSEANWKMPENMGHPVNSAKDDIYFFAAEQTALLSNAIVSSDRGTGCCLESYRITKAPKNKRLTGIINDCRDNTAAPGAKVILKDVSGKTWNTTTDAAGRFVFEIGPDLYHELSLTINKDQYLESASLFKPEKTDETDLLTDNLINATICIEKKPEEKPIEPPPLVIKAEDIVTVFFDFDKSLLKPEAVSKLDSIYKIMTENKDATVQISGYTDGLGSEEYNVKLSDRRARACAAYLLQKGISAGRINFVSFGACCPIEMEIINGRDNPDGRSRNRRALINVKKD